MKKMLIELVAHLRERRHNIVRTERVCYGDSDPTYGPPTIAEFEVVDFDALLSEIDEFAKGFK